jgi:hypothetical protein
MLKGVKYFMRQFKKKVLGFAMSAKDEEFSRIEPADQIPTKKYQERDHTYDKIITEFLESGLKIAKIKPILGRYPKSVYASLRNRCIEHNHPLTVSIRGDDIYLKRKTIKDQSSDHMHGHNET